MYIRIRIHQIVDDNSTGVRIFLFFYFLSAALSNSPKRQNDNVLMIIVQFIFLSIGDMKTGFLLLNA